MDIIDFDIKRRLPFETVSQIVKKVNLLIMKIIFDKYIYI